MAEWRTLASPPQSGRYNDVYFVNPDVGWVVNAEAQAWKTEDGGSSWRRQLQRTSALFRSVGFISPERGWVGNIGAGGFGTTETTVLFETGDGGESWSPVDAFMGPRPRGVCGMNVVDEATVCAVGRVRGPAFFVRTPDAGATWISKDMSGLAGGLIDVRFFDPLRGFAVGSTTVDNATSRGIILATEDGGETWEKRFETSRAGEWCWKISFPTERVGYVSLQRNQGAPVNVLRTVDGGETWDELEATSQPYFMQGIGFVTESQGWVGGNSTLPPLETRDGGETWSPAPIGNRMNRFRFLSDELGFCVGRRVHKFATAT